MDTPWPLVVCLVTAAAPALAAPKLAPLIERPSVSEVGALGDVHITGLDDPRVHLAPVSVAIRDVGDSSLAVVTLAATSTAERMHSAAVMVSLPLGARVVGLALVQGGRRFEDEPLPAPVASEKFIESTKIPVDPALAEIVEHGIDHTGVRVSLFPLSTERDAMVELAIVVPRVDRLVVTLLGERHEHRTTGPSLPATEADLALLAHAPVTAKTSLYVAPFDDGTADTELTRFARDHHDALMSCSSGTDVASAGVKLSIAADGHVRHAFVTSPDARVSACIAGVLETARFRGGVQVLDHARVTLPAHPGSASR
jgi:hypothetical protein